MWGARILFRCERPTGAFCLNILGGPLLFYLRAQVRGCIVDGCVFGLPTRPFLTVAP